MTFSPLRFPIADMRAPLALLCVMAVLGCGRGEPAKSAEPELAPPRPAEPSPASTEERGATRRSASPGIEVESEVGGLDQEAVDSNVAAAGPDIDRCWEQGALRNELIAGTIQMVLGVGSNGHSVYAYARQSTLGDGETERCMLKALSTRAWPKPVGGKIGVLRTSLAFDLPKDVRAPTKWSSTRAGEALRDASSEIAACKQGATASFTATVYVKQIELPPPDPALNDAGADAGDAGPTEVGAAISVGIAVSDEHGAAAVECLERVLTRAVYPPPGDRPAKLTFEL